jgi:hypothetical protein
MQATKKSPAQPKRSQRRLRARVASAFREMASGMADKAAYASTVRFYRSSGQEWAKQLG